MWLPEREEKEVSSCCDTKCQSNLMLIGQGELTDDDLRWRSGASEGSRSLTPPHPLLLSDNVLVKMLMRFPTGGGSDAEAAADATCRKRHLSPTPTTPPFIPHSPLVSFSSPIAGFFGGESSSGISVPCPFPLHLPLLSSLFLHIVFLPLFSAGRPSQQANVLVSNSRIPAGSSTAAGHQQMF